jgi:hypothetical protein
LGKWRSLSIGPPIRGAAVARLGCDSQTHRQIASLDKAGEAPFDGAALEQEVPIAFPAAQPDVRPKPVDEPLPAPARVGSPQGHHVAQAEFDNYGHVAGH